MKVTSQSDILDHSRKSATLASDPAALASLRTEILKGIEYFLWEFELQYGAKPEHEATVAAVKAAAGEISKRDLEWFADHHDWMAEGATKGAASLLKMVGTLGAGWRK